MTDQAHATPQLGATPAGSVPLDDELALLAEAGKASSRAPLPEVSDAEARERVISGNQLCSLGPDLARVVDVPVPVAGGTITARIYEDREPSATLLYLHGGGWFTGDLGYADELCRFLARDAGMRVVNLDYRLAPEHPFPGPLNDVRAGLDWVLAQYAGTGPVGVGGDSAGGNLAAVTVAESAHGQGSAVDFQFLLYPVTDSDFHRPSYQACAQAFPMGRADLEHCFARYLPAGVDPASPRVAPMRAEVLRGLPPALVAVAGHDPLHDEGVAYAERLRHEGVEVTMLDYPHLCHGFLRFTGASAGCRTAQTEIVTAARSLADTARPQ